MEFPTGINYPDRLHFPKELVLKIVKHYCDADAERKKCWWCVDTNQASGRSVSFKNHENHIDSVNAMIALREVATPFARACDIFYIRDNMYVHWGRKPHDEVLKLNTRLWWNELKELAGREITNGMLNRCLEDNKLSWKKKPYMRIIINNIDMFVDNPTIVFNTKQVSKFIKHALKANADEIAEEFPPAKISSHPRRNIITDSWDYSSLYPSLLTSRAMKSNEFYGFSGDKLASRTANTGISGLAASSGFNEDGTDTSPDLVINPHSLPTRPVLDAFAFSEAFARVFMFPPKKHYFGRPFDEPKFEELKLSPEGEKVGMAKHLAISPVLTFGSKFESLVQYCDTDSIWLEKVQNRPVMGIICTVPKITQEIARSVRLSTHQSLPTDRILVISLGSVGALKELRQEPEEEFKKPAHRIPKREKLQNSRTQLMRKTTKSTPPQFSKNRYRQSYR